MQCFQFQDSNNEFHNCVNVEKQLEASVLQHPWYLVKPFKTSLLQLADKFKLIVYFWKDHKEKKDNILVNLYLFVLI